MSKQALESIISWKNLWAEHSGKPLMDINNLSKEDADSLFRSIEGDLSPENLHCDGEISHAAAQKKANELYAALDQLESMGFTAPADCYF